MFIGLVKVHGLFSDGAIRNNRVQKFGPGLVHNAREKDISGGGPSSKTDQWIMDLRDPDSDVRYNAACALAKIGPAAAPAVHALAVCLRDENETNGVKYSAAFALEQIGPAAAPAVHALIICLNDKSETSESRYWAARALEKIGPAATPAIPALAICLSDEKSYVRSEGVNALMDTGPAAAPAVMLFLSQGNSVGDSIRERLSSFIRRLNKKEKILTPEKLSCETRERIAAGTTRILFQDFLHPEFSDDLYLACLLAINDRNEITKFEDILAKDYSSCDELLKDINLSLERFLTGKLTNSEMWGVLADEKLSEFGETRFDENIPRFSLYEDDRLKLREKAADLAMRLYKKIVAIYEEKTKTPSGPGY